MELITFERLKELLTYDRETGVFSWIANRGRAKAGAVAGTIHHKGYSVIQIDGHLYLAHRLAWMYETGDWPQHQIDHINGQRRDNRIANLRQATRAENVRNQKRAIHNTSGLKGVSWHKIRKKFQANIMFEGKAKHLGLFNCPTAAHFAYCRAAKELHSDFARFK